MKHPDINRTVMYDGMICRVWGVTYSTRNTIGGILYHLLPDGCYGLEHVIHDVKHDELALDPPVMVEWPWDKPANVLEFKTAQQNARAAKSVVE